MRPGAAGGLSGAKTGECVPGVFEAIVATRGGRAGAPLPQQNGRATGAEQFERLPPVQADQLPGRRQTFQNEVARERRPGRGERVGAPGGQQQLRPGRDGRDKRIPPGTRPDATERVPPKGQRRMMAVLAG